MAGKKSLSGHFFTGKQEIFIELLTCKNSFEDVY